MTISRDVLIKEMKEVFGTDQKRINHTLVVLDYAEQIQSVEGGDAFIVTAAAILHDIGIHQAEQKHGSSAGKYQEIEGPPIAERILKNYGVDENSLEHIYKIIANHHSARDFDTTEFRIIWDADWLVNIPRDFPDADKVKLQNIIDKVFKTPTGYKMAIELLLKG
jgi:HD superfamily phosphodiesterase